MTTDAIGPDEFERLYTDVAPELFAYIRRRSAADAEDVVAEVFTIAWRRRAALPEPELRRAWLYRTARNLLLADGRYRTQVASALRDLAHVAEPSDSAPVATANAVVQTALNRLSPQDREIILLTEWERLTPTEAAVALGIKPGTARVRLYRARQTLASDPELAAHIDDRVGVLADSAADRESVPLAVSRWLWRRLLEI